MSGVMIRIRRFLPRAILVTALIGGGFAIYLRISRSGVEPTDEGIAAYGRGDWARAEAVARERLRKSPGDAKALRLAARVEARRGRDQKAVAIYSQLVVADMEPTDFFLLGQAMARTGRVDSAMTALETALEGNPDDAETLDSLAQLYVRNDRYNAAERLAERLTRLPGWEPRGALLLGTARADLEDPAGAADALDLWLRLDPDGHLAAPNPARPFRSLLLRSLLKSRQPARARSLARRLLEAGPDAEVSWLLSRAAIQEQDWPHAEAAWKEGASFRTEHPLEFEPAPFIGAARCALCHRAQYDAHMAGRHAETFCRARDVDPRTLPDGPIAEPGGTGVSHQFRRNPQTLTIETRAKALALRGVVEYAFGSPDRMRTFTGRDERGRSLMFRISHFESPRGAGWDVAAGLPLKPAEPSQYLGKPMLDDDGIRRCLTCHVTSFRAILDEAGPAAADRAIGCETCHGPGAHHVAAVEARFAEPAIAAPGGASAAAINTLCGRCHSMHHEEKIAAPHTDAVWIRFQSLGLSWSRCFTESDGQLSCVTCHDPHSNAETSTSLNESRCLTCHAPRPAAPDVARGAKPSLPAATAAFAVCRVDPARGCLECHMPRAWMPSTHSYKTDHFIRVRDRDPD